MVSCSTDRHEALMASRSRHLRHNCKTNAHQSNCSLLSAHKREVFEKDTLARNEIVANALRSNCQLPLAPKERLLETLHADLSQRAQTPKQVQLRRNTNSTNETTTHEWSSCAAIRSKASPDCNAQGGIHDTICTSPSQTSLRSTDMWFMSPWVQRIRRL